MNILVLGGTRFFGKPMIEELLRQGHQVTIATRQNASDPFGDNVKRVKVERTDSTDLKRVFEGKKYDVVYDKIAYCSNDIKSLMDAVEFDRYIYMSSTAVYEPKKLDTKEDDFDGIHRDFVWCSRADFPYDQVKRHAECALWQLYSDKNWIAVRYPFVIGKDDYTKRLLFYVEHTMKSIPMYIDNIDDQMGFIDSREAGLFLAFLADQNITGPINGCNVGTTSIREIIRYVEDKTNTKAVLAADGEKAPYNGEPEYSINTDKAKSLGFEFSNLRDWIYELIDYYIELVK